MKLLLFSLLSYILGLTASGNPGADLVFVGDAMQHQGQLDQALIEGGGRHYDYSDCFKYIAPEIVSADYAVCNLEVPLGGGPDYSGFPCFSAPDSYAQALIDCGFDMMLTANNHCLDRRDKGARRTLVALDSLKIDHIGTYHDAAQRESLVPFIKEIKGIKVGFLNYTYGTNGIEPRQGMEVALIDKKKMAEEIRKTREAGAEIICVAVHWGVEYVLRENAEQRDIAKFLTDQGVDLIIGGHPHVIQPMQVVHNDKENKDVLIVYSLGNFISNMKTGDTRGGAMVRVRLERDPDGVARFKNANYDIFYSAKPTGKGTNYMVVPSWMPERIPQGELGNWGIFKRSALNIFDTYNVNVPRLHK
ncbi:MAG: CapA family protein [Clostridium sp.]|nr:CapA family protein [Prevotella sp.]MCM1429625.1 CapA family protein [Clostridium sp.]MCM1474691.1 CapA family protein [Muribaculaceae bacterium]